MLALALLASAEGLATQVPIRSSQGTTLHGTGRFEHVNIPVASFTSSRCKYLRLNKGVLEGQKLDGSGTCTGQDLIGTSFFAPYEGRIVRFSIQNARPHYNELARRKLCLPAGDCTPIPLPPKERVWNYNVGWALGTESGGLCPDGGDALAVPYAWSMSGEIIPESRSSHFTFACLSTLKGDHQEGGGAIAKCVDWGYPPWSKAGKTLQGHELKGTSLGGHLFKDDDAQARAFHQTCVRMATADYCGEGKTNTVDETPVAFSDVFSAQVVEGGTLKPRPTGLDVGFRFEAVWGVNAKGVARVLCFDQMRWANLPREAECLTLFDFLPHSKKPAAKQAVTLDGKVVFVGFPSIPPCTSQDMKTLEENGALLFTYSRELDRALVHFHGSTGSYYGAPVQHLTTSAAYRPQFDSLVYLLHREKLLDPASKSAAGSNYTGYGEFEGLIFGPESNLSVKDEWKLVPLYRCVNQDRFMTTTTAGCEGVPGFLASGVEGYIYGPDTPRGHGPALFLWTNDKGYFATSTAEPRGQGWESSARKLRLLGYLPQ